MLLTAQSPLAGLGHCEEITDFVGLGSFGGLIGAFWEPRINRAFHAYRLRTSGLRTWVWLLQRLLQQAVSVETRLETALLVLTMAVTLL